MAQKKGQRKESTTQNHSTAKKVVKAGAVSAATLGIAATAATGAALGYLFGTDHGANLRRGISKRANALMKDYGMKSTGRRAATA